MTQYNYKFIDRQGRVKYNGTDLRRLSITIVTETAFTDDDIIDLGDYAQQQWKDLARSSDAIQEPTHPWRMTDYRAEYLAGINQWRHRGRDVVLSLSGERANGIEHGWAPPKSSAWADGIGNYDGEHHDMRPWLLTSGHPSVHTVVPKKGKAKSKSGATLYRVLKYDTPALSEMLDQTASHLATLENVRSLVARQTEMNEQDRKRFLQQTRTRLYHTARSSMVRDEDGTLRFRALDMSDVDPATGTYGEHYNWVYHNASIQHMPPFKTMKAAMNFVMHKARFTVFRTITDSSSQQDRKLFYTQGIRPAGLISTPTSPLVQVIRQALINLVAGKMPDGRPKNGS